MSGSTYEQLDEELDRSRLEEVVKQRVKAFSREIHPCYLCGAEPSDGHIGVWVPSEKEKTILDVPKNRERRIIYALCKSCSSDLKTAAEKATKKVFEDALRDGLNSDDRGTGPPIPR
jgi:hypothetical protein